MAFDGIVNKAICSELQQLKGARIDKIFQPNKNNIILGCYVNAFNYAINICTDAQNCRIHLTTHPKSNPQIAPNFCMLLRKHLLGLHIKNIFTFGLERVIIIEFEGFNDIDDIISKKLIVELMGKHCNISLLDEQNIIIDCLRHINSTDEIHTKLPHSKYVFPTSTKLDFLSISSFEDFKNNINDISDINLLPKEISSTFNGISANFVKSIICKLNITVLNSSTFKDIYNYIENVISNIESLKLKFEITQDKKDYFLTVDESNKSDFKLNFFIDDFYYQKESSEELKMYKNTILKLILGNLKKYNKRLININEKLKECKDMDKYKLYGELIIANLYRIEDKNTGSINVENYYDNNNLLKIPLDIKYTPSQNAKRYYKKYNKLKNALEIVSIQKEETLKELDYIESIVYELENCDSLEELSIIYEEISESTAFKDIINKQKNKKQAKIKKSKFTKNKNVKFNPIKYSIDGYTFLVGKNNKENDYLTLKYAKKSDIWFHTKDIHGSHCILIINPGDIFPNNDILIKCAQITAFYSKARNSSNVPVDFCEVKYVKKPNGAKPGMVIYTNNKTLNVFPSKMP